MRTKLKITEGIFPMPVLMVATYNEDGSVNVTAAENVMVDGKIDMSKVTPSHLTSTPTSIIKSPSVWAMHSEMA